MEQNGLQKCREMVVPEARYILVKQYSNGFITENSMKARR